MTPATTVDPDLEEAAARASEHDLAEAIASGILPQVATATPLPAGNQCHFASSVRFGRRRADQCGHLEITTGRLQFHAVLDVSVAWSEVADVQRIGHDVIIALANSSRPLHFWCANIVDAARATVLARHFAHTCHAWA